MDHSKAKELGDKVLAILVREIPDYDFKLDGGTFSLAGYFNLKMIISERTEGASNTPERVNWKKQAESYGLQTDWLDSTFVHKDTHYKIAGLNPRKRKFPIVTITSLGKEVHCTPEFLIKNMSTR